MENEEGKRGRGGGVLVDQFAGARSQVKQRQLGWYRPFFSISSDIKKWVLGYQRYGLIPIPQNTKHLISRYGYQTGPYISVLGLRKSYTKTSTLRHSTCCIVLTLDHLQISIRVVVFNSIGVLHVFRYMWTYKFFWFASSVCLLLVSISCLMMDKNLCLGRSSFCWDFKIGWGIVTFPSWGTLKWLSWFFFLNVNNVKGFVYLS